MIWYFAKLYLFTFSDRNKFESRNIDCTITGEVTLYIELSYDAFCCVNWILKSMSKVGVDESTVASFQHFIFFLSLCSSFSSSFFTVSFHFYHKYSCRIIIFKVIALISKKPELKRSLQVWELATVLSSAQTFDIDFNDIIIYHYLTIVKLKLWYNVWFLSCFILQKVYR